MLYYLAKEVKINLPSIVFKYLREMVKEPKNKGSKPRKLIPLGRLISDIFVKSKLVEELEEMNFSKDLYTDVGKPFNGKKLKNMLMISKCVESGVLDKESISTRRVEIEDYPYFTMLDPRVF